MKDYKESVKQMYAITIKELYIVIEPFFEILLKCKFSFFMALNVKGYSDTVSVWLNYTKVKSISQIPSLNHLFP